MTVLNVAQIKQYAYQAGFRGNALNIVTAIALGESGGNTKARNTTGNSKGTDRGLMQINSAYHPSVSDAEADDALFSMRYAYKISAHGTSFQPWSVYKSGAYKRHMLKVQGTKIDTDGRLSLDELGGAIKAGTKVGLDNSGTAGAAIGGAATVATAAPALMGRVSTFLTATYKWIADAHNWLRVAAVVGGGVGLLVGAVLLASVVGVGNGTVGGAVGAASNVIPIRRGRMSA